MSWIAGCLYRPEFDRYATTKSGGQLVLNGGLLAENIMELFDVYKVGPVYEQYYYPLMAILIIILTLNLTGIILSVILAVRKYPAKNPYAEGAVGAASPSETSNMDVEYTTPSVCPKSMKIMNDILTVTTLLVLILVISKSTIRTGRQGLLKYSGNGTFTKIL